MITWKPQEERFGGGESAFGIDFREGEPEIAKLLSDAAGQYQNGKTATDGKYEYKAKVVNKDQKTYVFITRKPLGAAPAQAAGHNGDDRDARIQKMHDESFKLQQEAYKLELEKHELAKQQFALDQAVLGALSDIGQNLKIIAMFTSEGKSFLTADKLKTEAKAQ